MGIKNVEDVIDKVVESRSFEKVSDFEQLQISKEIDALSKNIISTVHSLSESVKNRYRFEKYLLPYFKSLSHHENNNKYENVKYFDTKFYQNILEIMQIVFKIPESIYTVIEIKNVNKTKHQKN